MEIFQGLQEEILLGKIWKSCKACKEEPGEGRTGCGWHTSSQPQRNFKYKYKYKNKYKYKYKYMYKYKYKYEAPQPNQTGAG